MVVLHSRDHHIKIHGFWVFRLLKPNLECTLAKNHHKGFVLLWHHSNGTSHSLDNDLLVSQMVDTQHSLLTKVLLANVKC